jgi:hypothetical protein
MRAPRSPQYTPETHDSDRRVEPTRIPTIFPKHLSNNQLPMDSPSHKRKPKRTYSARDFENDSPTRSSQYVRRPIVSQSHLSNITTRSPLLQDHPHHSHRNLLHESRRHARHLLLLQFNTLPRGRGGKRSMPQSMYDHFVLQPC